MVSVARVILGDALLDRHHRSADISCLGEDTPTHEERGRHRSRAKQNLSLLPEDEGDGRAQEAETDSEHAGNEPAWKAISSAL